MCTNDPSLQPPAQSLGQPAQIVEKIAYDMAFTDELIRRCRARAAQGYRLAATFATSNKAEVTLVFELIEWNGVPFPTSASRSPTGHP